MCSRTQHDICPHTGGSSLILLLFLLLSLLSLSLLLLLLLLLSPFFLYLLTSYLSFTIYYHTSLSFFLSHLITCISISYIALYFNCFSYPLTYLYFSIRIFIAHYSFQFYFLFCFFFLFKIFF